MCIKPSQTGIIYEVTSLIPAVSRTLFWHLQRDKDRSTLCIFIHSSANPAHHIFSISSLFSMNHKTTHAASPLISRVFKNLVAEQSLCTPQRAKLFLRYKFHAIAKGSAVSSLLSPQEYSPVPSTCWHSLYWCFLPLHFTTAPLTFSAKKVP